jgi:hypothetical protein
MLRLLVPSEYWTRQVLGRCQEAISDGDISAAEAFDMPDLSQVDNKNVAFAVGCNMRWSLSNETPHTALPNCRTPHHGGTTQLLEGKCLVGPRPSRPLMATCLSKSTELLGPPNQIFGARMGMICDDARRQIKDRHARKERPLSSSNRHRAGNGAAGLTCSP